MRSDAAICEFAFKHSLFDSGIYSIFVQPVIRIRLPRESFPETMGSIVESLLPGVDAGLSAWETTRHRPCSADGHCRPMLV